MAGLPWVDWSLWTTIGVVGGSNSRIRLVRVGFKQWRCLPLLKTLVRQLADSMSTRFYQQAFKAFLNGAHNAANEDTNEPIANCIGLDGRVDGFGVFRRVGRRFFSRVRSATYARKRRSCVRSPVSPPPPSRTGPKPSPFGLVLPVLELGPPPTAEMALLS